jgi:small conductance mechanosensitive channel
MANQINTQVPVNSSGSGSDTIDFANLGPYILTKFLLVLEAALIIIAGLFLLRYVKKYLSRLSVEHEQQKTAINLFEKLTTGFVVVISITLALRTVGIDMTLLVSVTILGLSYGLQDIIKNYVAGILIMFKSPFKIGDTIEIKGHVGKIENIDFNSTSLRTFDQKDITIYNNDVMTQSIVNYSRSKLKRIDIDITLGYGSNYLLAFQIFDRILTNNPNILKKPAHKIVFKKFGDNGLVFSIRAWVNFPSNIMAIKSDLALQMSKAFDEENIYMPYTKDAQLEVDYTLTEKRKAEIAQSRQNPIFAINEAPEFPAVGELIDFDELS